MSKVFFQTGISLDGFMAGENRGPQNPIGDDGPKIHEWMYNQRAFLKIQQMEGGAENNPDNSIIENGFENVGSFIMGKRMFEEGELHWPEDLYKTDVYVLTHEIRKPWIQKGSTTFYFINDGIISALTKARESAKGKDTRIMGGADTIQQFINAGLIDRFVVHIAPIFLGKGIRLLDNIDKSKISVQITDVINSPSVTHVLYSVTNKKV